jgi:hypothetical protein
VLRGERERVGLLHRHDVGQLLTTAGAAAPASSSSPHAAVSIDAKKKRLPGVIVIAVHRGG